MKKSLLAISFLLFSLPQLFAEQCFLYIEKPGNINPQITSTLAISLISQYIEKLESVPITGLGKHDCVYKLGVTESKEGMFVTISGRGLSAYGDSKNGNLDGLQQALLRSIYRAKLDKKDEICKAYGTILKDDCNFHASNAQRNSKTGVHQTDKENSQTVNDFQVDLKKCYRSSHTIRCDLTVTNLKYDRKLNLGWGNSPKTRIFDDLGNEYKFSQQYYDKYSLIRVANKSDNRSITHLMLSGIPVNVQLAFSSFSPEASIIAMLEFELNDEKEDLFVKFRNIAVEK